MANKEVPLLYNQHRLNALKKALEKSDVSLELELKKALDALYRQYVPEEEQKEIELKISREEMFAKAAKEFQAAFGVYHLHNTDGDMHIAARKYNNLLDFSRLYQSHLCRKVDTYTVDSLACLFGEYRELDAPWFQVLCDTFKSNDAVSLIADVDFERGYITLLEQGNQDWMTYRLDDIADAAAEAFENPDASDYERWETFLSELCGKEIDAADVPSEDEGAVLQQ